MAAATAIGAAALAGAVAIGAAASAVPTARDDVARLDAFERLLAGQDSATVALGRWCVARGLADGRRIVARPVAGIAPPPDRAQRRLLQIGPRARVGYRHVALSCGANLLSVAHNWYVPARLPAAMRVALAAGDRPFGAVIAPLGFRRERLGGARGAGPGCPAATVLTQRALIRLASGRPLALVIECYQPAVLKGTAGS